MSRSRHSGRRRECEDFETGAREVWHSSGMSDIHLLPTEQQVVDMLRTSEASRPRRVEAALAAFAGDMVLPPPQLGGVSAV